MIEKIKKDLIKALKQKDKTKVSVLRMVQSAIKNLEITKKREKLTREDIITIIKQQIKQRKDSIEQFKKGNRKDLAEQEEQELAILEKYMPKQMSEQEIKKIVQKIISSGISEFGPVMGKAMAEIKDKADGSLVKKIVEQELSN